MIKSLEVIGLPGRSEPLTLKFHRDLNIITGRNGAGKTTLLKLIWYIISGNIEHAMREIPFNKLLLVTDEYSISIMKNTSRPNRIEITVRGESKTFTEFADDEDNPFRDLEQSANEAVSTFGSSVFFPTFRRIEGGFSINAPAPPTAYRPATRARSDIEDALLSLSRRLTVERHTFVTSISTVDIVNLLMRNYTELSENTNRLQRSTSESIINEIRNYKREAETENIMSNADDVIDTIRSMIEKLDQDSASIMSPLDAVRKIVERIFHHSGIKLGSRLSFGDAANAVSSEMLSAGEKQMLSFICYNAFYHNSVFFIDEPELSLHVDWQRQLFATLIEQSTNNQFIIATHSPFIYSKYSDKEIMIGTDRGASSEFVD